MLSLSLLIAVVIAALVLNAATLTLAARAAGTTRRRWRTGWLALLLIYLVALPVFLAGQTIPDDASELTWAAYTGIFLVAIWAVLVMLKGTFRLPFGRAFIPFGIHVAFNIIAAVLLSVLIKPLLFQMFGTTSSSMAPTLERGDRIAVSKLIRPRRWDLVVYWDVAHGRSALCKRLVGLPGERLRFDRGKLYINNEPVDSPPLIAACFTPSPSGRPPSFGRYTEGETIYLGAEDYFFVGDNPDQSMDSRFNGPTEGKDLIGVVDLICWPPGKWRILR